MVFSLQRDLSQQRLTFNKRDIPTMTFSSERHPPYNAHLLMKSTFSQMSSPFITGVVETLTTEKMQTTDLLSLFVWLFLFVFLLKCDFYFILSFISFSSFKNKSKENFITFSPQDLKVIQIYQQFWWNFQTSRFDGVWNLECVGLLYAVQLLACSPSCSEALKKK